MAETVRTERLDLVPLEPETLQWIRSGDVGAVERALASQVPVGWTDTIPAHLRLEQLAAGPSEQPWLVRAMVLQQSRQVVGSVGFHGPPDAHGRVELGYDVITAHRRRGYAREAILGLTGWAFATGRARTCAASVSPDNTPSIALLHSLGFADVGERIDDVDGLEHVFERPLPLP